MQSGNSPLEPRFISQEESNLAQRLIDFIDQSPTAFHTVENIKKLLMVKGFVELKLNEAWPIVPGEKYFLTMNDSALIAFSAGTGDPEREGFRILGAHTDSPSFRLKPSPEIPMEHHIKLNVESYGSPILSTWFDRPLSLAGRIILRGKNIFFPETRLINIGRPLLTIPNLAIHLNRKVNEGIELNIQKDLLPLLATINAGLAKESILEAMLSETMSISPEEILDFDLYLYEFSKGQILGLRNEFISAGRLDDLAMVHAGILALTEAKTACCTNILVCFDNEECGSSSKQGAASPLLATALERIMLGYKKSRDDYFQAMANSFLISLDMAQALHPNAIEKYDPVNKPYLNAGPVIKLSANQSYTSDGDSSAVFTSLCQQAGVPVQKFVNRSGERGGSTIGPITATHLNIRSVDVGNPLLAMHSIRELAGVKDHAALLKVLMAFYEG